MTTPTPTRKTAANERIIWGPWWRAAFIGVGLLGVLAIAFAIWLHSDADLRAVERRAKAEGIPLTWKELGRTQSPPEILERWKLLESALKRCPSWQGKGAVAKGSKWTPNWIGVPPPPSFIAHHEQLDPKDLIYINEQIDALGNEPIRFYAEPRFFTPMPELAVERESIRLLAERMVLAEPSEVGSACLRMLNLADRAERELLISYLVGASLDSLSLQPMIYRCADVRNSQQFAAILAWLDKRATDPLSGLEHCMNAELCFTMRLFREDAAIATNYMSETSNRIFPKVLYRPAVRFGRAALINEMLDIVVLLRTRPSVSAVIHEGQRRSTILAAGANWDPRVILRRSILPSLDGVIKQHLRTVIFCRLVAAYLRDQPLPTDPCDPAGGPLRPILRDGVMIGAYSLGIDQVDDGGDTDKDFCFALTARLGLRNAADLPKAEKP